MQPLLKLLLLVSNTGRMLPALEKKDSENRNASAWSLMSGTVFAQTTLTYGLLEHYSVYGAEMCSLCLHSRMVAELVLLFICRCLCQCYCGYTTLSMPKIQECTKNCISAVFCASFYPHIFSGNIYVQIRTGKIEHILKVMSPYITFSPHFNSFSPDYNLFEVTKGVCNTGQYVVYRC